MLLSYVDDIVESETGREGVEGGIEGRERRRMANGKSLASNHCPLSTIVKNNTRNGYTSLNDFTQVFDLGEIFPSPRPSLPLPN